MLELHVRKTMMLHVFIVAASLLDILTTVLGAPEKSKISAKDASIPDDLSAEVNKFGVPRDTPIAFLDGIQAFNNLQPIEKCRVHHISRASWTGALIDLYQTSAESPLIFLLLQNLFRSQEISALKRTATEACKFQQEDWDSLLVYVAAFYDNFGNYFTYGMKKFVPRVSSSKLECLINSTAALAKQAGESASSLQSLWNKTKELIYQLGSRHQSLAFGPGGITTYFSSNCNASDATLVKDFMVSKNVEAWNSRVIKTFDTQTGQPKYEIRFASALATGKAVVVDELKLGVAIEYKGASFTFTRGDFKQLLVRVNQQLTQAKGCLASSLEKQMTDELIRSFRTGSVEAHKNASRFWVKNKNPVIESYIGFIETYQDPDGMRGSFEGWVAVVDKAKTAILTSLVNNAEKFLPLLPWPREFEKDKFLKPDFTDLTVITFGNGGPPAAINIPNYSEIRQNDGFKNVNLGNMIAATLSAKPLQYLSESDAKLLQSHRKLVFDTIVGLHELLGHGSGKMFHEFANGSFDFDISKLGSVGKFGPVKNWYKPGETFETKFGRLGSTLEECRAETVACYLGLFPQVLSIWGINRTAAEQHSYMLWLEYAIEGLEGLIQYTPETDSWGEAHDQGRFAMLRVMIESGVASVKSLTGADGKPDLLVSLDRKRIPTDGKKAMGEFLLGLNFYRSTGDVEGAKIFYDSYTSLKQPGNEEHIKWHKIVVERKKPRPLVVQPNTVIASDSPSACQTIKGAQQCFFEVHLKNYDGTAEGMIQSYLDRYTDTSLEKDLLDLANTDFKSFWI
ncbi:Dipeptidyl peptidase 3 [Hypsibius exemplaris]|uniref:Dipeptidyl peptidase 3 n=1 Tax=Hypsibius exemplaris TaxID=2072580 RepID=A0A1W0XDG6_HYPEX|nr:Dipeptidyl peptidase 3 [Hypsibius exemplaris]